MKPVKKLPLTKECHHWRRLGEVPWDLQKYWQQRHTIFSNYNEGIYMTHDAWYGVTPEPVAIQIANDTDGAFPALAKTTVVDLFAGAGANAISFALQPHPLEPRRPRWGRVVAVERDAATLACAQHNASLHGVLEAITWVLGDSFEFLAEAVGRSSSSSSDDDDDGGGSRGEGDLKIDPAATVLFASPPWGGPGYSTDAVFDLGTMEPYNLARLHGAYRAMDHALYLPRTSDLRQIARLAPVVDDDDVEMGDGGGEKGQDKNKEKNRKKIEVVQYCVEGASKALVAYIPAATSSSSPSNILEGNGT